MRTLAAHGFAALRRHWNAFWFAPGDPRNLGAARILVSLHAAWMLLSRDAAASSALPSWFWSWARDEAAQRFLLLPGHPRLESALVGLALAALAALALGVAPRPSALLAAALLYHLGPLYTIVATLDPINRGLTINVLCLAVLGAAPCGDAWSVRPDPRRSERTAADYGWPLRLMWLFVAEIYLFGAIGKLRSDGLTWFAGNNIRRNLVQFEHMHPGTGDRLTAFISASPLLLDALGIAVLCLEATFVACLFSRWARRILIPSAVAFHLAILWSMRIVFANLAHLGLFVNWGWLAARFARRERLTAAVDTPIPSGP